MRKLLSLITLLCMPVFGAINYPMPQVIGFVPSNATSAQTTALSTAANAGLWAFSYSPPATITLQNVSIEISAVTGTLGATDMKVDVYSDLGGAATKPNATLANSTSSSSQVAGFITWGGGGTGYNVSLTGGTTYWFVLSNQNGTPTSNFPTVRWGATASASPSQNSSLCQKCDWMVAVSTNTGSTWTLTNTQVPMVRLDFTDGSSAGMPWTNIALDATNVVYSTREVGNQFTTQGTQLVVQGVAASVGRGNAPTGNLRFGIWNCTGGVTCTNLGYTNGQVNTVAASGGSTITDKFSTPITIPANSTIIISLGESTQSDASSINYRLVSATVDSNSLSLALKQLGGAATKGAYCTGTCGTYANWTTTTTTVYGFSILLNPPGEFVSIPVSSSIAQ